VAATVTRRGTDCDYVVQDLMSKRFVRLTKIGSVRWTVVAGWDAGIREVQPTKADAVTCAERMIDGP
jgi:hypothetical protein